MSERPVVAVVMGSDSDWPVMRAAADALAEFAVPYEADVVSAHRMPHDMIGYGGAAYAKGTKALKIKKDDASPAIEPTEENVINNSYPIWRYLFVYVNPSLDKGEIAAYLNWIRGEEGQKLVKEVGYYPLPEKLRQ